MFRGQKKEFFATAYERAAEGSFEENRISKIEVCEVRVRELLRVTETRVTEYTYMWVGVYLSPMVTMATWKDWKDSGALGRDGEIDDMQ